MQYSNIYKYTVAFLGILQTQPKKIAAKQYLGRGILLVKETKQVCSSALQKAGTCLLI